MAVKFSILVVCLNPGAKLAETVESIRKQEYRDYEIIVKDGGSKDGSAGLLPADEKIRLIEKKDTGIYDAMNQAVSEAAGEYVLFLNCGDLFYDGQVLTRTAEAMEKNPGKGIYYGDTYCRKTDSLQTAPGRMTPFQCFRNIPCHQSCFYARRLFADRKYLPEYRIRADYEHFLRCVLGNDVGCPWITQYDFWRELYYFHKYVGVSNAFALYTATARSAEMAGIGDVTGTLEKGKAADMIVTKENPLDDLKALRHVDMVVASGRLIRNPRFKRREQVEAELDKFL